MGYGNHELTDLYHYHAKSEDVPFPGGFIASLEDLWRGPRRSISLCLSYGTRVQSPDNCGEPEIRQTRVAAAVDENVGLDQGHQYGLKRSRENTCPLQVSVYRKVCMKIVETFCNIQQLGEITLSIKFFARKDSPGRSDLRLGFSQRNLSEFRSASTPTRFAKALL